MMTLTESWVDCVTWRAGMPYLPHIEQLREMRRRERAIGGPAEHTFEALLGLSLQPKTLREAAEKWEEITAKEGTKARDKMWSHPDLLLPIENEIRASGKDSDASSASDADSVSNAGSSLESSLTKNADSAADSNSKETLSGNSNDCRKNQRDDLAGSWILEGFLKRGKTDFPAGLMYKRPLE